MPRTFNRAPMTVNVPSNSDVKQYFFNHSNWKGLSDNKNVLTVDQETFSDCNNVYVDSDGLLKSRSGVEKTSVIVQLENGTTQLSDIIDAWVFDTVTVYETEVNNSYVLTFVSSNIEKATQLQLDEKDVVPIFSKQKIFLFTSYSFRYYDITTGKIYDATEFVHIPTTQIYFNDEQTDAFVPESENELTDSYIIKHIYDTATAKTLETVLGKEVTLVVDGQRYKVTFTENSTIIFVNKYTSLSSSNFVTHLNSTIPCVAVSADGKSCIVSSYINGSWFIKHTINGISFVDLPFLSGVICKPYISDDGNYCIAFKTNGPHIYRLLEVGENKYSTWTNLLQHIDVTKYAELNITISDAKSVSAHFLSDIDFAFSYCQNVNDFFCIVCQNKNISKNIVFNADRDVLVSYADSDTKSYTSEKTTTSQGGSSWNSLPYRIVLFQYGTFEQVQYRRSTTLTDVKYNVTYEDGKYFAHFSVDTPYQSYNKDFVIDNYPNLQGWSETIAAGDGNFVRITMSSVNVNAPISDAAGNVTFTATLLAKEYYTFIKGKELEYAHPNYKTYCRFWTESPVCKILYSPFTVCLDFIFEVLDTDYPAVVKTVYNVLANKQEYYSLYSDNNTKYAARPENSSMKLSSSDGVFSLDYCHWVVLGPDAKLYVLSKDNYLKTVRYTDFNTLYVQFCETSIETYLITNDELFNLSRNTSVKTLFPIIPIRYIGNDAKQLFVADDKQVYYNDYTTFTVDEIVPGPTRYFMPTSYVKSDNYHFSINNKLHISDSYVSYEVDKNGNIVYDIDNDNWYFPKRNTQSFDKSIVNLHSISKDVVAIFFNNGIQYARYDADLDAYRYYESKIPVGCLNNCDVLTTYDGKYTMFTSERGLAVMSHQQLISTDEQEITYISDVIHDRFKQYSKHGNIKLLKYEFWIFVYNINESFLYLLDIRNNSWWKLTYPGKVDKIIVDKSIKFIIERSCFDNSDGEVVSWKIKSQKLHFNAVNYSKHISNITLTSVYDKSVDDVNFKLQINLYRNRTYGNIDSPDDYTTLDYTVDNVKTHVQRLNYSKVNEFQYLLSSNDNTNITEQLSLSNIIIKYKVSNQVR